MIVCLCGAELAAALPAELDQPAAVVCASCGGTATITATAGGYDIAFGFLHPTTDTAVG